MSWWKRKPSAAQAGSVLFRGRWVARPEDFAHLAAAGVRSGPAAPRPDGGWSLPLEHAEWGRATLLALPGLPPPPPAVVASDPRLYDDEKAEVSSCQQAFAVVSEPRRGNVLADRKDLLRFLRAVMGEEGVAGIDHTAQAIWTRAGLDEELAHDAELDIDAIYTLHLIHADPEPRPDGRRRPLWVHSHGLQEIGFQDFDVLDPDEGIAGHAHELLRALAFATVEGSLRPHGPPFTLVAGEEVRAVSARAFLEEAPAEASARYRELVDPDHVSGHVVLCDRPPGSWLARLLRGGKPRPSRFLRGPLPDEVLIQFSHAATDLMARRARQTLPLFASLVEELAELDFPAMVKLGYRVDGGDPEDREHLWFQVHTLRGDAVEATLVNEPFRVSSLRRDQRGSYPLELLSDWTILTPFGAVDPRQTRTLRFLRGNRERVRQLLAEARSTPGSG